MKQIHCPDCHKLLLKANFADIEIVCKGCGKLVKVKLYTAKSLLLTAKDQADNIESESRS